MSSVKTGLMFSPLTKKVYWGRMNVKTGVSVGDNQKDITSDFMGIMLQKFPLNMRQKISCNGKVEAVVFVADEEKANRYEQSKAMYKMLDYLQENPCEINIIHIRRLLAKARGEQ